METTPQAGPFPEGGVMRYVIGERKFVLKRRVRCSW